MDRRSYSQLAVVGGGPAGLRAAEVAASAGLQVTLYEGKPSVGRKFLVAGRGGLNLTHGEPLDRFAVRYSGPGQSAALWPRLIAGFDPAALRQWAAGLGVETFQATSGRVYPVEMKAAPLLRRWVARLRGLGVKFAMNHRLVALESLMGQPPPAVQVQRAPSPAVRQAKVPVGLETGGGAGSTSSGSTTARFQLGFVNGTTATADAVILALGGASWPETGSDGAWTGLLESLGLAVHPLASANCGWEHEWPPEVLARAEGKPLKNVHVRAGDTLAVGELLITRYGLEGGAIYQLGAALRAMAEPAIAIDFKPTFTHEQLVAKMASVRRNFLDEALIRWRIGEAAQAILSRQAWTDAASLAREVKHCVIPLLRPRLIGEAISSAGGVCWSELDTGLMVKRFPGLFVAGEMIDWEAPTGGYLMQGCFATGTRAAQSAVEWLRQ
jgi:predicted flavoprotein YhiN